MSSNPNSKTENLQIKIKKDFNKFLSLVSSSDPRSDFCRSRIAETFMRYGFFVFFTEEADYDLSNFDFCVKQIRRFTENHQFDKVLDKILSSKKIERRPLKNGE